MNISKQLLGLAFFIIMVEILAIMVMVNATKDKIESGLIDEEFKRELSTASQAAHSLKQDMLGIENLLSLVAQSPEIQSESSDVCNTKLDQVFTILNKKVGNVVRINEKGVIFCAVNRDAIGRNALTDPGIASIIKDPEHKPVLRRITFSDLSNKYVAGIHLPVFNKSGRFIGTIGGVIYFDELDEKYFKDFTLLDTGTLMLIDDNGDMLYNSTFPEFVGKNLLSDEVVNQVSDQEDYQAKTKEVLANVGNNRPSFMRYYDPPQPEMIVTFYPVEMLPGHYWAVGISVPADEVINQLNNDSLIGGFKNFSALAVAMVTIVFVTQICLFLWLISRMPTTAKAKDLK
jgi:hypothetical protein